MYFEGAMGAGMATAAVIWLVSAMRRTRRERKVLTRLGRAHDGSLQGVAGDAVIVLEGTLERVGHDAVADSTAPLVETFHPEGVVAMIEPNHYAHTVEHAGVRIRMADGACVELDEQAQVVLGTTERRAVRGADGGERRMLFAGDRVRARGVLRVVSSESPGDTGALTEESYRSGANAYRLVPPSDAEWKRHPIALAAPSTSFARAALANNPARTTATTVVLMALVSTPAFFGLRYLERKPWLGPQRARDAQSTSATPTLAPARPACAAAVDQALAASDPWAAKAKLGACDDALGRARTAWLLGDFAEASTAFTEARRRDPSSELTVSEAEAHGISGHYQAATATVERMIATWYPGPDSDEKKFLACVADGLRTRDGSKEALERLHAREYPHNEQCSLIWLAHDPNASNYGGGGNTYRPYWEEHLMLAKDVERSLPRGEVGVGTYDLGSVFREPRAQLHMVPIAWTKAIADAARLRKPAPPPGDAWERDHAIARELSLGTYAGMTALFFAYAGDMKQAEDYARDAEAHGRSYAVRKVEWGDPDWDRESQRRGFRDDAMILAAAAAAEAGDFAKAKARVEVAEKSGDVWQRLDHVAYLRSGRKPPRLDTFDTYFNPDHEVFAAFGQDGELDAAALARILEERHWTGRQVLARVLPYVRGDRAPLRRWVRERFVAPCAGCGLWALFENLAERRFAAQLLGDSELEARLRQALVPVVAALTKTDEAMVALIFLETFRETGKL